MPEAEDNCHLLPKDTHKISLQKVMLYKAPEVGLGALFRKLNKLEFFLSIKPIDYVTWSVFI